MAQTAADAASGKIGVLTVSDRASRGEYEDRGGPRVQQYLKEHFDNYDVEARVVPDDQPLIEAAIVELCKTCGLVLTTGGTGPAPRDVTPEATHAVCQKMLPGFGEVMRAVSYATVPTSILSRQTAGICNSSLVVNLPGNPKAIPECLDPVLKAIPPAVRHSGSGHTLNLKPEFKEKNSRCS